MAASTAGIKVYCRFRPLTEAEKQSEQNLYEISLPEGSKAVRLFRTSFEEVFYFGFDGVFDGNASQEDVYKSCALPLLQEMLKGYNCTIFAYGQSGSGKTHTMMGSLEEASQENRGIIPRLAKDLFEFIKSSSSPEEIEFTIRVSFIEIYKERILDLLAEKNNKYSLRILQDKQNGIFVENVIEEYVSSPEEFMNLVYQGNKRRSLGSTLINPHSSRSHSVFMITVTQASPFENKKVGTLFVVDLAGSEMVKKTGATQDTLEEAKTINKSLSALGNVIKAVSESATFVPFRDSKLTRLLKNSIGGNAKTSLIVNCSGGTAETLSSIRFGARAKTITNAPIVNKVLCDNPLCIALKRRLEIVEHNNRVSSTPLQDENTNPNRKYDKLKMEMQLLETEVKQKQSKIKALEHQITKLESSIALSTRLERKVDNLNRTEREMQLEQDIIQLTQKYIETKVSLENSTADALPPKKVFLNLERQIAHSKEEINLLREQLKRSTQSRETFQSKLDNRESHICLLETTLKEFQEMYKDQLEAYSEEIDYLRNLLKDSKIKVSTPTSRRKSKLRKVLRSRGT